MYKLVHMLASPSWHRRRIGTSTCCFLSADSSFEATLPYLGLCEFNQVSSAGCVTVTHGEFVQLDLIDRKLTPEACARI